MEFEWQGWIVEVWEKEVLLFRDPKEEVDLIFEESDFIAGNMDDFIEKRGEGYDIYSYTPRGGTTKYYLIKKSINE